MKATVRRILVVSDDLDVVADLRNALEPHHACVTQATGAAQARTIAAFQSWRFDVVILETCIPDGDGFELCAALRRLGFDKPILMLSDAGSIADIARGLDVGVDDYLLKPYSVTSLLARLNARAAVSSAS